MSQDPQKNHPRSLSHWKYETNAVIGSLVYPSLMFIIQCNRYFLGIPSFIRSPKGYNWHSLSILTLVMWWLWRWCRLMGMTGELMIIVCDIFIFRLLNLACCGDLPWFYFTIIVHLITRTELFEEQNRQTKM